MRVVIAEDDALLREGLVLLLGTEGIEVAAATDNPDDFHDAVAAERPDAVIVDVRLPPTFTDEGLRAAVAARKLVPGLPVLVLSAYVEDSYASDLLGDGTGGIGYLLKERVGKVRTFLDALHRIVAGGTALDPEVVTQLMVRRHADDPIRTLTPRERDVLSLMAEGRTNSGIAEELVVSEPAVSKHIGNIFMKLGLPSSESGHRRVLAVLTYLRASRPAPGNAVVASADPWADRQRRRQEAGPSNSRRTSRAGTLDRRLLELARQVRQDLGPAGRHVLERVPVTWVVKVEAAVLQEQPAAGAFGLDTPRERPVHVALPEGVGDQAVLLDRGDRAGLPAPPTHVDREPVPDLGADVAGGPPGGEAVGLGQHAPHLRGRLGDELANVHRLGHRTPP